MAFIFRILAFFVGLRDPHIQITFHIPQNDLAELMDERWAEENTSTTIEGIPSEAAYWRQGDNRSASLFVSAPDDDGIVSVLYDGDNPSTKWLG